MNKCQIDQLLRKRDELRAEGKFTEADKLRAELESSGYIVQDTLQKTIVEQKEVKNQPHLVLFGSGETSSVGRSVHEYVLKKIGKSGVQIALITTPAGFQPNVARVYGEIAEFFERSLANFHPKVSIVYANDRNDANNKEIIKPILEADYIFTGPGSPTYAASHLSDTLLINYIKKRVQEGASLSLASAAAIAFSKYCLPVYEIYKVGSILYWEKGLDFYSEVHNELTVIPHFNNTEGGEKTDTSCCYMGVERFNKLLEKLPVGEDLISIDEQTAYVINLTSGENRTLGKGKAGTIMYS